MGVLLVILGVAAAAGAIAGVAWLATMWWGLGAIGRELERQGDDERRRRG